MKLPNQVEEIFHKMTPAEMEEIEKRDRLDHDAEVLQQMNKIAKRKLRGKFIRPVGIVARKKDNVDDPACSRPTDVEAAKGKQMEVILCCPEINHAEEVNNKDADLFLESDCVSWDLIGAPPPGSSRIEKLKTVNETAKCDQVEETFHGTEITPGEMEDIKERDHLSEVLRHINNISKRRIRGNLIRPVHIVAWKKENVDDSACCRPTDVGAAKGNQGGVTLNGREITPAEMEEIEKRDRLDHDAEVLRQINNIAKRKLRGNFYRPVCIVRKKKKADDPACCWPTDVEASKGKQVEETLSGPEITPAKTEEIKENNDFSEVLRRIKISSDQKIGENFN